MADATYNPGGTGVYRDQGGAGLTVGSTGRITLSSSDVCVMNDGGITIGTSGKFQMPVSSGTTTAAISNYGVTTITKGTTGTGANAYTLTAPVAGTYKWLSVTTANVSEFITVSSGTNVTFLPGGSANLLKIVAAGGIALVGLSASSWSTIGVSTIVAFPTS